MKLRAAFKCTINTKTMILKSHPIIESIIPPSRRYLPLQIQGVWMYNSVEERDKVLSQLTRATA